MFNGTDGAEGDTTLRAEVAYWLIMMLCAKHCKYGTCVTNRNELVRSQHRVGIVPCNAFVTQLHQTLHHKIKSAYKSHADNMLQRSVQHIMSSLEYNCVNSSNPTALMMLKGCALCINLFF